MQVDNEIAHHCVVHGTLRRAPPGSERRLVVWIDADHVELGQIAKLATVEGHEFAAKDEVQ